MVTSNGLSIHSLPERACLLSFEGPFCWAFFYFVFFRIISTTLTFIHNVAARKKVESFLGLDIAWRISKKMPLWWHSTWRRIAPVRELFFFLSSLWTVKEKELKNIFCYFNSYKKPKAARGERAVFCYSSDVAISWLYTSRLGVYTLESIGSAFDFFIFFHDFFHFLLYNPMPSRSAGKFSDSVSVHA